MDSVGNIVTDVLDEKGWRQKVLEKMAVELFAEGSGTRLTVTEHGCFLDGLDNVEQRRRGTSDLLDALGRSLAQN